MELDEEPQYRLHISEKVNARYEAVSDEAMADPFHTTTIRLRGWRVALAVLRGRYAVTCTVSATPDRTAEVMRLGLGYRTSVVLSTGDAVQGTEP